MIRTRTTRPSTAAPVKPIRTMTGPSASNAAPVETPKPRGPKPVLLNVTEACEILGISTRSWRRYRARGGPLSHLVPTKAPKGSKGLFFLKRDIVAAKRDISKYVKAQSETNNLTQTSATTLPTTPVTVKRTVATDIRAQGEKE